VTKQQALNCLGLSRRPSKKSVHTQYAKLVREWNLRLNNASSIEQRREAQEKLGELKEAKALAEGPARKPRRKAGSTKRTTSKKKTSKKRTSKRRPSPQATRQATSTPANTTTTYSQPIPPTNTRASSRSRGTKLPTNSDWAKILIAIIGLLLLMSAARTRELKKQRESRKANSFSKTHSDRAKPPKLTGPPTGRLVVETSPSAKVFIGSRYLGDAPSLNKHDLPVGKHQIRLIFESGQERSIPVNIEQGKKTVLRYNLHTGVLATNDS